MIQDIFKDYLKSDSGATAVEYGLFVGIFSVAFMAMWASTGEDLMPDFDSISENLTLDSAGDDGAGDGGE